MSKIIETAMEAAYKFVASKAGERVDCQQVATHLGWTFAHTSRVLLALAQKMRIMISPSKRNRTYWVAKKENIAAPSPSHDLPRTSPLKVDKHRIELYRRLEQDRAAIPSRG